ncbi:MAG: archaetidylserine decarboxylase [Steroidobacteraceae bacterium]
MARVFVLLQYLLPQHLLSRGIYHLTRCRVHWVKDALIGAFMRGYRPVVSDAVQPDPHAYESFNAFFTRALRSDARPLAAAGQILSPVDGAVSEAGDLDEDRLLQAKGRHYTLAELLAGHDDWCRKLRGGQFATIYLAPFNYHRIHMAAAGTLTDAWHVPGALFSVNNATAQRVPRLFARNERVVCAFDSPHGPYVLVLVGALFVGSMSTVWHGEVTPMRGPRRVQPLQPRPDAAPLQRAAGEELGRFNMGSTVILLTPPGFGRFAPRLRPGAVLRMGEAIGQLGLACT